MKKVISIALLALLTATTASALTFWNGPILMGTVCRNGPYYTLYPVHMAQPVGTVCPLRNNYGNIVGSGVVTDE